MAGGIQLAPLLTQMKVDIKTFKSDMDKVKVEAVGRAKEVSKSMESAAKVGEKMSDIGGKMTKAITLPIVGAGTAAAKFSMDFSDSLAKVNTIADTTKVPLEDLKKGVLDLSDKTGMAASELNEGLYQAISASVDTANAVDFLGVAVKAAKAGFTDTATAVDGLTTVLNSYGMSAEQADKIANQMLITQNEGKTSFGELASAVGKVTPIAAGLGITTEELFSSLASTTAQGLATSESVTALKAAMSNIIKPSKEASEAAEALGISFDVSSLRAKGWMPFLQEMTEKLKQASPELDKTLNEYVRTIKKISALEKSKSKESKEELKIAKRHLSNLKKELEVLAQASDSNVGAMATMFGSVEGLNSILMLTSENGAAKYNKTMEQMKTNTTALNDAFNKMDQTPGTEMKKALNDIKNLGIEMGDILMPVIRDVIKSVRGVTEGFKNLSPHTKEAIVKTALFAATMGPLLSVTGKTITAFTKLKPIVSGLGTVFGGGTPLVGKFLGKLGLTKAVGATATTALGSVGTAAGTAAGAGGLGALAGSLGTAALAATPFVAAGAAIVGTGYLIHKEMQKEVIPTVDLFADKVGIASAGVEDSYGGMVQAIQTETVKISDATKQAVGAYMDMDKEVSNALFNMKVNNTVITDEIKNDMISKFSNMNSTIVTEMQRRNDEMYEGSKKFFNNNSALTDQEEQKILANIQTNNANKLQEQQNYQHRIQEIWIAASNDNRKLTKEEQDEVNSIQEKMRENAVKTLSKTKEESAVILQRLKDYSGKMTADQASTMAQNAKKAKEDSVAEAEKQYEETIKWVERMKEQGTFETEEQADRIINQAKRQRDESVKAAEEMQKGVINKIKESNPEIEKSVDLQAGNIRSAWSSAIYDIKSSWESLMDKIKGTKVSGKIGSAGSGSGGRQVSVAMNASGTNYFEGGLTTLHEKGYEVYDLPRSTRIYNHDASQDLVIKTARQVAEGVLKNFKDNNGVNVTNNFYGKVDSPYEVAKATKKSMRDLSFG